MISSFGGSACFFMLGVVVHVVLVYSIFDIYFASPIVRNARPHQFRTSKHQSKRIVFFSADGLRARTFFEKPEKSPFLHSLIKGNKAAWGIASSHVPTESRPGHVAMMAGIFEDVSAVTRGWSANPVAFDSVFNQSKAAFLFGSPDIVPMFGEKLNHASTFYYSHEEEDFSRNDAAFLDRWVFEKFTNLLNDSDAMVDSEQTIFFLHLLGLDTNGHGFKPYSHKYVDNIQVVDTGIEDVVKLVNGRFPDGQTTFIFTADHGMTDWGSHGAGTLDEIEVPFLIWGHGIKPTGLMERINQVDLAPLQSSLLGIPIPVNSLGILPSNLLNFPAKYKCDMSCTNLKQMVEQFGLKRAEKQRNALPFSFREFPGFKASVLNKVDESVYQLIRLKRFDAAAQMCLDWVPRVRDGLYYFHRYNRFSLGIAITLLFLGWISVLYTFTRWGKFRELATFNPTKLFWSLLLVEATITWTHAWPWAHLVFYALPTYVIALVSNSHMISLNQVYAYCADLHSLRSTVTSFVVYTILVVMFVAAFFERSVVSLMLLMIAPYPHVVGTTHKSWAHAWSGLCMMLAVFPFLPPVGNVPVPVLTWLCPLIAAVMFKSCESYTSLCMKHRVNKIVAAMFLSSFINMYRWKTGTTTWWTRMLSFATLTFGFVFPLNGDGVMVNTLLTWISCMYLVYSLMCMAYEGVFILLFMALLVCYIRLEYGHLPVSGILELRLNTTKSRTKSKLFELDQRTLGPFDSQEWQRAALLVLLVEVAFFGTGNLAALNGFNPSTVVNFMSIFSPFSMASLIVLKIAIPFLQLCFSMTVVLQSQPRLLPRLAVLLMIITDSMALVFFFNLKDDGSWLEIGMTISHYAISLAMSVAVFALLHVTKWIMNLSSH